MGKEVDFGEKNRDAVFGLFLCRVQGQSANPMVAFMLVV